MLNKIIREGKNINNILVVGLLAFAILSFLSLSIGAGMTGVVLSAIMAGAVCVYQFVDRPNIPSQEEILVTNEKCSKKKRTLWSVIAPYFEQKRSTHRARMRVMYELDNMGIISLYLRYKREGRLEDLLEEELEYSESAFPVAVVAAAVVATGAVGSARADVQQSAQQNAATSIVNSTAPVELTPGGFPAVRNTTPTEEDYLGMNDEPEIVPEVVDCSEEPECFDNDGSITACDDDYMFDDDDLYYA